MRKFLVSITGVLLVLAIACGSSATAPTATTGPQIPIPTSTATSVPQISTRSHTATAVPQSPPPTPIAVREWELQKIAVNGNTVTVTLHVFAGIDVDVTLGGAGPSRVDASIPVLAFVFEDVPAGEHAVVVSDIVGFSETASVTVEAPNPEDNWYPAWLAKWLEELDSGKVEFPPQAIFRFQDRGETVYYVIPDCCDQFSDLLDADGNLIGHPDGGITGRGDGVTKFSRDLDEGEVIWPAP